MNKKLVLGIVVGVAVLLAIVIAIFSITGTFGKIDKDNNSDTPSSSTVSGGEVINNNSSGGSSSGANNSSEDKKTDTEVIVKAKKAKKNSIISIPVEIDNNPGFCAGTFAFKYDTDLLAYVDYKKGEILDSYDVADKDGNLTFLIFSSKTEDVKKNGTVITLNFRVKKESSDGNYIITIDNEGTMLGNSIPKEVKADITLGKAKVKK